MENTGKGGVLPQGIADRETVENPALEFKAPSLAFLKQETMPTGMLRQGVFALRLRRVSPFCNQPFAFGFHVQVVDLSCAVLLGWHYASAHHAGVWQEPFANGFLQGVSHEPSACC